MLLEIIMTSFISFSSLWIDCRDEVKNGPSLLDAVILLLFCDGLF